MEGLNLVTDLALILISAGVVTLLFKWLKQPLVLGYIVAGFIVGPHFNLFPTVIGEEMVKEWSEIGIIFLLFALGLDFSFKKLMRIGGTALITAGVEIISMFIVGVVTGKALGWTGMESVFLGGMIAMSSTSIIIKAFDDLGLRKQKFTNIVFGTLVFEDLVAILLLVVLSTLAVGHQSNGLDLLFVILKLVFFLVLWVLVGIFVLPTFFKRFSKTMNDEMLLIISIGLCFGMVILAVQVGFSFALGAFVMGSLLAETVEGVKIEKLVTPIKNLFGAIFFVSVGMMVDPKVIMDHWGMILILIAVVLIGRTMFPTFGVLLSGQPLKTAMQAGFCFGQIGEFAFIIATLGINLGVVQDFVYPMIVSVSVVSTFLTPYNIKLAGPFYNFIYKHSSASVKAQIDNYSVAENKNLQEESDWKKYLKFYSVRTLIYTVMLIAVDLTFTKFVFPYVEDWLIDELGWSQVWVGTICSLVAISVLSPFIIGLLTNKHSMSEISNRLWNSSRLNKGGIISVMLLRMLIAVMSIFMVVYHAFEFSSYGFILVWAIGILLVLIAMRGWLKGYLRLERVFLNNFNQKENIEKEATPIRTNFMSQFANSDVHMENITVSPDSKLVGLRLMDAPFKDEYGVMVVKIERGSKYINLPQGTEYIYPGDKLLVMGTDEQIQRLMPVLDVAEKEKEENIYITLFSVDVDEKSSLVGKSIADSGIRAADCMVLGIERGGDAIMNPSVKEELKLGDVLWLVGDKSKLSTLNV